MLWRMATTRLAPGMRAVRWHARDDIRLDEVPRPVPSGSQVLLRVEGAAICGTDVDEARLGPITVPVEPHPVSGRSAPMTLGHEIVGVVAEAGPESVLGVGRRVAPWPSQPCGTCLECTSGHQNRCVRQAALGMAVDGGMAEFVLVDGSACDELGADVALDRAVLVEPFAVALHAAHLVDVERGRIAVVGIGSLGICMIEVAVRAGAREVIAMSRYESSREAARSAGATTVVAPEAAAGVEAEIAFETAGAAAAVTASIGAVRPGGQVVVLGGHPATSVGLDLLDLVVREVTVQGSVSHCRADFAAARAITAGELGRTRRVEFAPLEAGPALLREAGGATKRILVPGLP
jgi:(R,R)-butanediol dehydrogenase/meso-butanediol dehydrogenase/diacetyl reductase